MADLRQLELDEKAGTLVKAQDVAAAYRDSFEAILRAVRQLHTAAAELMAAVSREGEPGLRQGLIEQERQICERIIDGMKALEEKQRPKE
jgi:hypothetical protein